MNNFLLPIMHWNIKIVLVSPEILLQLMIINQTYANSVIDDDLSNIVVD